MGDNPNQEPIIVIDIGNNYFTICTFDGKHSHVLTNGFSERTTESYLRFHNNTFELGKIALASTTKSKAKATIFGVRRVRKLMQNSSKKEELEKLITFSLDMDNNEFSIEVPNQGRIKIPPSKFYSEIIKECALIVNQKLNLELKEVFLTLPSHGIPEDYNPIISAFKEADINVTETVFETTAGAVDYLYDQYSKKGYIIEEPFIVFKMGGSVTEILFANVSEMREFKVVKTMIDPYLGGDNITDLMIVYCSDIIKKQYHVKIFTKAPYYSLC